MKKYLLLVLLLASFLRFWQLGTNPPSLTWDEVAWGYNAYSLGIDGRDEFGKLLPIQYIESFGDFKPPIYAYLDILPVKIFGLNEFAVRFPSAFFGVLTVLVTYFLVIRLFHPRGVLAGAHHPGGVKFIALLSALFLAISPWHINLSRTAFEANVATFFIVLGMFLFLHAISRGGASFPLRRWNSLVLSLTSFILSMYTFNTARIVAPLLVIILALGFRRELIEQKKQTIIAFLTGAILILPLGQFLLSPQAQLRFYEVNIFSDPGIIGRSNQEIANDQNAWWSKILHNRRVAFSLEYLRHYFDHFNPSFLFIKGDGNPKFSTQDVGQLYLWEAPFLIAGILFLLKKRMGYWWLLPIWLLAGIVPAGIARETPHALRIETTLPTWQILVAYGIINVIQQFKIQNSKFKIYLITFALALLVLNFIYYFHGYWAHYPREFSGEWQYGYKDAINYVKSVESQYDIIVFTEVLGRPYIYTLFYTKENPAIFRETAKVAREVYGFAHVESYGRYKFTRSPRDIKRTSGSILYVDVPENVAGGANILKTFNLLNGEPILVAYTL